MLYLRDLRQYAKQIKSSLAKAAPYIIIIYIYLFKRLGKWRGSEGISFLNPITPWRLIFVRSVWVISVHQHFRHKHLVNETMPVTFFNETSYVTTLGVFNSDTNMLDRFLAKKSISLHSYIKLWLFTPLNRPKYHEFLLWGLIVRFCGEARYSPYNVVQRWLGSGQKLSGRLCPECWWTLIIDTFHAKIEVDSNFSEQ